jgi:D-3-phosphoglycerate dehydrogenase
MRCLVVQPIDPAGPALLREAGVLVETAPDTQLETLASMLTHADAVITRNWGFPKEAMALAPRLRVVASHGTGVDRIDIAAANARRIRVVNTPGANAPDVAELALGLMLALARELNAADLAVRAGEHNWRSLHRGRALGGLCLALWGYGAVARALVPMARGLGMEVIALSAHASSDDLARDGVVKVFGAAELLSRADVLSLHGLPRDRPLLDAAALATLRPGALVINTARGALIDEVALADALQQGHLGGAALDVTQVEPLPPDSRLRGAPRLILTPHLGGTTDRGLRRTAVAVAQAVLDALGICAPKGNRL